MATAQPRQWGTTPPMSTARPTKQENEQTDALLEELKRENNFEPPEDTQRRYGNEFESNNRY
jgi:poly(A) polymerase